MLAALLLVSGALTLFYVPVLPTVSQLLPSPWESPTSRPRCSAGVPTGPDR